MAAVYLSSDHRGFALKQQIIQYWPEIIATLPVEQQDYQLVDLGPASYQSEDDFNDAAIAVAQHVLGDSSTDTPPALGILLCGSAHGIAIQANRFPGIRAICAYTPELAQLGRQHNDANVLCLSADFTDPAQINSTIQTFLSTPFLAEDRFLRRNRRLDQPISGVAVPDANKSTNVSTGSAPGTSTTTENTSAEPTPKQETP